ncbi:MAG: hypothetical protein M0Z66_05690 [Thermaerobacter sp.]|nr:hypothetical protein [Thermaerobacter sp.]
MTIAESAAAVLVPLVAQAPGVAGAYLFGSVLTVMRDLPHATLEG